MFKEQFAIIPEANPIAVIEKEMFELLSKIIEFIFVFPIIPAALWTTIDVTFAVVFVIFIFITLSARPKRLLALTIILNIEL